MKTVKLSYSIINNWMSGRFEEAVSMYLGKPLPKNPYMELGSVKHKVWENHTLKTSTLHPELGGYELIKPIVEKKYERIIPLGKYQILFRGVIDLEHGDERVVIEDFKCGIGNPGNYISSWQLDAYKLLRPHVVEGRYRCYNPYSDTYSVGVKFLGDSNFKLAVDNIVTFGGEMIDYLESQRLVIDYQGDRL